MDLGDSEIDASGYRDHPRPLVRFGAIGEAWELIQQQWVVWSLAALLVILGNGTVTGVVSSAFGLHHQGGVGGFRGPWPRGGTAVYFVLSAIINGLFVGGLF